MCKVEVAEKVTPERLVEVAIELFGREGFDAVTTRAIADAAGVQQSAIGYHFGTKNQLYLACAEHIAAEVRARVEPLLAHLESPSSRKEAVHAVEAVVSGLAAVMMQAEIAPMAQFVVREQMNPTPAFTVLYDGAMRHLVEPLVAVVSTFSSDRLGPEKLRARCFALIGAVFAFRYARAALMCVMGWEDIGPRETEIVQEAAVAHARAIFADFYIHPGDRL